MPSGDQFMHQTKLFFIFPIEQPAENKHRFRYKSEGRATGTLLGENATDDIKTYPKIKILGYQGPAHAYLSCVDEKPPYR